MHTSRRSHPRGTCVAGAERGATAVEYALLAVCIAVAIVVVVQGVGTQVRAMVEAVKW